MYFIVDKNKQYISQVTIVNILDLVQLNYTILQTAL